MHRATWKGVVLAEGDDVQVVDGYPYLRAAALKTQHFRPSEKHTVCHWKGTASYYDVVVGDDVNANAAWYYPEPKPEAEHVRGWVGFWRGVQVD